MKRFFSISLIALLVIVFANSTGIYAADPNHPTVIVLTIGSTTYTINGVPHQSDAAPYIENGRTMVPLRVVAEALPGAEIKNWDNATQTVTISRRVVSGNTVNTMEVSLRIGQALPNGMGTAVIQGGRTFVPVAYVSEFLGASTEWNGTARTVTITDNVAFALATTISNNPAPSAEVAEFERRVFDGINADRVSQGLAPLVWNDTLANAARWRSQNNDRYQGAPADPMARVTTVGRNETAADIVEQSITHVRLHHATSTEIGVGYDPANERITVAFTRPDILESRNGIHGSVHHRAHPYWIEESPYSADFFAIFNPFHIPTLLAAGKSESEIAQMWEQELFRLTNVERERHGVRAVAWDDSLGRAARWFSEDTGSGRSHIGSDGSNPDERARREGWRGNNAMENAIGSSRSAAPETLIMGWLASSSGHRENLLNPAHTHLGTGFGHNAGLGAWTEHSAWNSLELYGQNRIERTPSAIQVFGER